VDGLRKVCLETSQESCQCVTPVRGLEQSKATKQAVDGATFREMIDRGELVGLGVELRNEHRFQLHKVVVDGDLLHQVVPHGSHNGHARCSPRKAMMSGL